MGRLVTKSLLVVLYLSSTITASSHIFARQQATCLANFSKCPQTSLPGNFCCPSSSTCIVLAAATTILCCPAGSDCSTIASITCNLEQQDPIKNPNGTVKTTALTSTLGKCGAKCCPFGYTCNKETNCQLDRNQDLPPPAPTSTASSIPSTSTSTPAATNSISPITTATPAPLPSPTAIPITTEACPRFPILSIIIFFFTGLIAGILITLFTLFILLKCTSRTPKSSNLRRASTQSFGNKVSFQGSSAPPTSSAGSKFISSPKLNPDSATRSDFLRKQEWDGTPSRKQGGGGTIKNLINRMSRGKPIRSEGMPVEPIPALPSHNTPPPTQQTPVRIPSPLQIRKISNPTSNKNAEKKPQHPVTPPNQRAPSSQDEFGQIVVFTDGQTADELRQQTGGSNYKETGGSGLGIGNGNTMNGGGLLPPPTFLGERDRGSAVTTFTQFIPSKEEGGGSVSGNGVGKKGHRRTSSAIAGLVPHQPFNYNSPAGYSSPAYSDTGSRMQKM